MKKMLLLFCLIALFASSQSIAQTTVTSSVFPAAGDVLKTKFLGGVSAVVTITPAGGNQTWDYSNITTGTAYAKTVAAAASTVFPAADVKIYTPSLNGYTYMDVTANKMEWIGFSGDFLGIGTNFDIPFINPETVIETPLNYQDTYTDDAKFRIGVKLTNYPALDSLVNGLLDSLLPPNVDLVIDSVRITFTSNTTSDVDAWGQVILSNSATPYDVLREKLVRYTHTKIEMKGTLFGGLISTGWIDPTSPPPTLGLPAIALPFAGADTLRAYNFYADNSKEPIVVLTVDADDTVTGMEYKDASGVGLFGATATNGGQVRLFPNPATDYVNIELTNFQSGTYQISIFNVIGSKIYDDSYDVRANREALRINVSDFAKGTYLYSIADEKGVPSPPSDLWS